MWIYILVLVLVLCLIFRDTIVKVIKGKKTNFYKSQTIKSKTYEIDLSDRKDLYIDVFDTDIKILCDKDIKDVSIQSDYLVEESSYQVSYDKEGIKVVRNNRENYRGIGNVGRVFIKIPEKTLLNKLNILLTNGDIEVYDINSDYLNIKSNNGWIKLDDVRLNYMNIFKEHGDVSVNSGDILNIRLDIQNGNGDFVDVYGDNMDINVINGDFIYANSDDNYEVKELNVNVENGKKVLDIKYLE